MRFKKKIKGTVYVKRSQHHICEVKKKKNFGNCWVKSKQRSLHSVDPKLQFGIENQAEAYHNYSYMTRSNS